MGLPLNIFYPNPIWSFRKITLLWHLVCCGISPISVTDLVKKDVGKNQLQSPCPAGDLFYCGWIPYLHEVSNGLKHLLIMDDRV